MGSRMGLTVMRNEQSAEKLMAPADCTGWRTAGAPQPARRVRYANVGARPGEREEEKPAQRREMQMTGTEISAENPGLTAGAGARLSLTPSGLCHGCRGGGGGRLPLGTPGPGSGPRPRWGCRKMELGRTKKLEARGWFLQGERFLWKWLWGGRGVQEATSGVGNAVAAGLSDSWYRWPTRASTMWAEGKQAGRESTWAPERPGP